jgi:hypothetical protein
MKTDKQLQEIYSGEIRRLSHLFGRNCAELFRGIQTIGNNYEPLKHEEVICAAFNGTGNDVTVYEIILNYLGYSTEIDTQFAEWRDRANVNN